MTYPISDVTRRVVYSGSAGTGPYSFSFEVLLQGDIAVYFNDTLLTITTDYTVTINANGTGSVTIVTGTNVPSTPDSGDTITILGNKGIQRQTDFVTGGDLFASSLNDELDAQTIFAQQNAEAIGRAIKIPPQSSLSIDTTLPVPQANYILGWNDDGTAILNLQEIGSYKGTDATTTTANYVNRDLVKSTTAGQLNNVYICIQDSPAGTALTNTSYWALLVDAVSAATSSASASDFADEAEEWATKVDGIVESTDYSAKAWSIGGTGVTTTSGKGAAKEWATSTGAAVDTSEYSAKEYAIGTHTTTGSAKQWANTTGSAIDSEYSAKEYALGDLTASGGSAKAWAQDTSSPDGTTTKSAKTWATEASASASAASSSATDAQTAQTAAESAQSAAEAARDSALAAYDNFDDRYLGAKSSDPSTDNDGDPLAAGMLYYNTTVPEMRLYTGSAWVAAYVSGAAYLASANNLSDLADADAALVNLGLTATATELNYTDGVTSAIQTQLDTKASTGKAIAMAIVFG
jgi:hypothetical protein